MPDSWNTNALNGLERRVTNVEDGLGRANRKLDQIDEKLDERFDRIDEAHEQPTRVSWWSVAKLVAGSATGVGVPVAVAIIAAGGS